MDELIGTTLGGYRINALIGQGNRASVYQATEVDTRQPFAVRVFDRDLGADRTFVERFRRVAEALKALQHPHLLPVRDYGQEGDLAFLVRPYVAGGTLRNALGAPLPLSDAIRLLVPIAAALDYAHEQGMVHGDMKPGNILLPALDRPVLTDLGIAQLLPRGNSLLMAARSLHYGTPEYLSPEQAHGLPLDGRTDVYTLGIILYEALTGQPPFRAGAASDSARAVAMRHITTAPPGPRTLNPAISPAVEQVLLRALAKDPDKRFATCGAIFVELAEHAPPGRSATIVAPPPHREPAPAVAPDAGDQTARGLRRLLPPLEDAAVAPDAGNRAAPDTAAPPPPPRQSEKVEMDMPTPPRNWYARLNPEPKREPPAPATPPPVPPPPAATQILMDEPAGPADAAPSARHATEVQVLRQSYETRLAAQAEALRGKDAEIEALGRQLAALQREREADAAKLREHDELRQERDALEARVKELEQTRQQVVRALSHDLGTVAIGTAKVGQNGAVTPPEGRLVIVDHERGGPAAGTSITLRSGMLVGRQDDAEIKLTDIFVSAEHARLTLEGDEWRVTDLGTTNGTFVNGTRIKQPTALRPGDEVRFGRVRARFS
ncbi:MAG TPA: protein kinase [Thermomicrobiales bacterium]|nr:protein kinase [Thermomicrobiales bacterium]